MVKEEQKVKARAVLARWDPHMLPILNEKSGRIRLEDIIEDVTMRREVDAGTGFERWVIAEHKGDHHPQVVIEDDTGAPIAIYPIPEKAYVEVRPGDKVVAGTILAKTPREITGTQDITGGLPRIIELFEARKPHDPAVLSEIDGTVEFGDRKRGYRTIIVKGESGIQVEHLVPHGKHMLVHKSDRVKAGQRLVEGPLILQDILRINGEEELQQYVLHEIQSVYHSQNVFINDKHVEILIRQMLRKVKIEEPGDTNFLPTDIVSKGIFRKTNEDVKQKGGKPATASSLLLGIARASLYSDSFVAAASFQETTKVLTDAAIMGRRDELIGLKENVILGHVIPAGTGYTLYSDRLVKKNAEPPKVEAEKAPLAVPAPAQELEEVKEK